jgi:hypothetical protein
MENRITRDVMDTPTYTRREAERALGIESPTAFHYLRRTYPSAFVIVQKGTGKGNPTLYDKQALDRFIAWRNEYKNERASKS